METVTSQDHEDELELGLGLSLGSGSGGGGGGGVKILTAQDLPSVMTGNHSGGCRRSGGGANISGNKRAAADSPGSPPPVSQVVGWPPIRTYRMNNLANQTTKTEEGKKILGNENSCSSHQNNNNKTNNDANKKPNNGGLDKSKAPPPMRETGQIGFVKVNMDGVQIGRKIDLNAHACYDTLAQTIEEMFFKPNSCTSIGSTRGDVQQQQPPPPTKRSSSKLLEGSSEFVLVYEDKEGDWMLVGDVPWGMFLSTVKRLRIMRTCEANGLAAPRFQERSLERQRSKHI